jgi:hypothetical protein
MTIGCASLFPAGAPAEYTERAQLPSCGHEARSQVDPPDQEMRSCLLTAFEQGRPAELAATFPTVEGDPLTTYYRVWPTADIAVEVFSDSSRDKWRSAAWTYTVCDGMAASDTRDVFELTGCPDAPQVLVP